MTYAEAMKRAEVWRDFAYADYADIPEVDREALAVLRRAEPLLKAVEKEDDWQIIGEWLDAWRAELPQPITPNEDEAFQLIGGLIKAALAYRSAK